MEALPGFAVGSSAFAANFFRAERSEGQRKRALRLCVLGCDEAEKVSIMSAVKSPVSVRRAEVVTEPTVIGSAERPSRQEARSALLDSVSEETARARAKLDLPSGRSVEAIAEGTADRLTVRNREGLVELEVLMTERGPLLRFRSADLELTSTGEVRVDCERFQVRAEKDIVHVSGGNLELAAEGAVKVRAKEELDAASRTARITARRGNVELEANDDVRLLGERVKLNC